MSPEQIAERLGQAIRDKEYAPGDPLIQEELAAKFKVSRNPVREALRILNAAGLVTITQGNGAAVRERSLADLTELYDIRLALEMQIAPHIIEGATRRSLTELRELIAQMEHADSLLAWSRLNFQFHTRVYSLADRPHTASILHSVLSSVQPYSFQNADLLDGRPRSDHAHAEIVDAIDQGDPGTLIEVFRNHLEFTKSKLQQLYTTG